MILIIHSPEKKQQNIFYEKLRRGLLLKKFDPVAIDGQGGVDAAV